jgi:hypothetical protein
VAEFAGKAPAPSLKLPAQDQTRPDPGSHRDVENVVDPARRPATPFTVSRRIRVIVKYHS